MKTSKKSWKLNPITKLRVEQQLRAGVRVKVIMNELRESGTVISRQALSRLAQRHGIMIGKWQCVSRGLTVKGVEP